MEEEINLLNDPEVERSLKTNQKGKPLSEGNQQEQVLNQDQDQDQDQDEYESLNEDDLLYKKLKYIQKESSFFCDYITFQFESEAERNRLISILIKKVGSMEIRDINIDKVARYNKPTTFLGKKEKKKITALMDQDPYKTTLFYVSFAGQDSSIIYTYLFEAEILRYARGNKKPVELKRLDFKYFLEVNKVCNEATPLDPKYSRYFEIQKSQPDALQPPYLNLGLELNTIVSTQHVFSVDPKANKNLITWTSSPTGWNIILGANSRQKKLRIYYKTAPESLEKTGQKIRECVHLELQLSKTIVNKFTEHWKKNNFSEFIKSGLDEYKKAMNELPDSNIKSLYTAFVFPTIQSYLNIFYTQNFTRNSVITGIKCIWPENQKNENFFLENTNEFVSFLAIYISIINHANQESWKLEKFKRIPFTSQENVKLFKFSLTNLLSLVGWNDTPHLRLKMKKSLMALHTYKISSSPLMQGKDDRRSGFNCLITNLNMDNSNVELSINMRVLVTLIEPISSVDLSIFSYILPEYNKKFKADNRTKMTYPFYFTLWLRRF